MFDFFGELKMILVSLTKVASLVQHVNCDEAGSSMDSCDHMDTEDPEIQVKLAPKLLYDPLKLKIRNPFIVDYFHGKRKSLIWVGYTIT